jgi:hypothetical protein
MEVGMTDKEKQDQNDDKHKKTDDKKSEGQKA